MPRFALVHDGVVDNVIVADGAGFGQSLGFTTIELPEGSPVGPGWLHDGQSFAEPAPPESVLERRRITRLAFRMRLTAAEKAAIYTAADQVVALRVFLDDLQAATFVDLDDPVTRGGVQQLEMFGLLPPGRAAVILDAAVQPGERPAEG